MACLPAIGCAFKRWQAGGERFVDRFYLRPDFFWPADHDRKPISLSPHASRCPGIKKMNASLCQFLGACLRIAEKRIAAFDYNIAFGQGQRLWANNKFSNP